MRSRFVGRASDGCPANAASLALPGGCAMFPALPGTLTCLLHGVVHNERTASHNETRATRGAGVPRHSRRRSTPILLSLGGLAYRLLCERRKNARGKATSEVSKGGYFREDSHT